jgi:EAL domain-containing protein (putative c-di-GMP-specific phosphodiesterase class I)
VSPKRMFGAARRAGLLFNLDWAARTKAIEKSSGLQIASKIFINFNPASIYDPTYCLRSAIDAIEKSNLSPDQIVFEATESEKIKDSRHLRNILDFCREHGFRVALDDLGAGYGFSNLLGDLRPNFVKLDVGLVQGVGRDPYRTMIALKILGLARNLKVGIVAEGVETEEQWRWLAAHGADFVQGYFFAKPAFPPSVPAPACA